MKYDAVVIGGGIVGLASAWSLLKQKPSIKIALVEKEAQLSQHQTGNNSGVIHSGIYYKPGSLKAQNCLRGYDMLLEFAKKYGIAHELCGKVIVATQESELPVLESIYQRGLENGLSQIKKISASQIREIEPHIAGKAGIFVPYTGIIDYRAVAEKLGELIAENGGHIKLKTPVLQVRQGGKEVITPNETLQTALTINCAGLYSDKIAQMTMPSAQNVRIIPFKGEYYELKPQSRYLIKNLVYPVPDPNFPFLGVHFTRMIGGGVEAGPNAVFSLGRESYRKSQVNLKETLESLSWPGFQKIALKYWKTGLGEVYRSFSKAAFVAALQKLCPKISAEDLVSGGAGIRAQACDKDGGLIDDFLILEDRNVINVCNAPSPAATSCLSIGLSVSEKALKRF
jgi:L-2-hydroxyglutarate oxidase